MSAERTFDRDCSSAEVVQSVLCALAEEVGRRLRRDGRYASVAHLKLRWADFTTITRQKPFLAPCRDDFALRQTAFELLRAQSPTAPVRLVGFGVNGLRERAEEQLDLFADSAGRSDRRELLSEAVDRLRDEYGRTAIRRGRSIPPPRPSS